MVMAIVATVLMMFETVISMLVTPTMDILVVVCHDEVSTRNIFDWYLPP